MYFGYVAIASLSSSEQQAMAWAAENTPGDSRFLVISGDRWGEDRSAEWFPALAERISVGTVQGSEWLPAGEFDRGWRAAEELQKCAGLDVSCVEDWIRNTGETVTHLYVAKRAILPAVTLGGLETPASEDCCFTLRQSLDSDRRYELIHENSDAAIYLRNTAPSANGGEIVASRKP